VFVTAGRKAHEAAADSNHIATTKLLSSTN